MPDFPKIFCFPGWRKVAGCFIVNLLIHKLIYQFLAEQFLADLWLTGRFSFFNWGWASPNQAMQHIRVSFPRCTGHLRR
jgi:hypothetical protein